MTELSEEDQLRITKAKVLELFSQEKKNHILAVGLCVLLGFTGSHRFYLGQIPQGFVALFIGCVLFVGGIYNAIEQGEYYMFGAAQAFVGYGIFVAIESFLTLRATDKVNAKIRDGLEKEYDLR